MTRNIIIFGVGNSSSSHTDTCKNNFLVLGGGPTDDINDNIGAEEKKFSIKFSKAMTKFGWVYLSVAIIVSGFLTKNKSISLKLKIKMSSPNIFWTQCQVTRSII